MSVTITKVYKKGTNEDLVTTIIPQSPILNVYSLFAMSVLKAPLSPTKEIRVTNVTIDETKMMPTGKQFASANIVCEADNTSTLVLPPVEYNLQGDHSITDDDLPEGYEDCKDRTTVLTQVANDKARLVQMSMYKGTLNRNVQIGMNILFTGKLEAHNSSFTFGTDHIVASEKQYGDDGFDIMDFINDKLMEGSYDKICISSADIKAFKGSMVDCGNDSCTTKGFVKFTGTQENIKEKGYIQLGYHEDTMTPIYAVDATVRDVVRDETTGKKTLANVTLFPKGKMTFTRGTPIRHKFAAMQWTGKAGDTNVSMPKRTRFRQWQEVSDANTNLISGRLQTGLTPYVASFEDVLVVTGLS